MKTLRAMIESGIRAALRRAQPKTSHRLPDRSFGGNQARARECDVVGNPPGFLRPQRPVIA